MTKPLRVLQIASFTGNVGDNANHCGTRRQFARHLPVPFEYTNLEIREFFWGQRQWDEQLVEYINRFDLLMVGGGNFFELWVETSRTGCSIDLSLDLLQKIRCPMLFYGLGVDPGQGVPQGCRQRFSEFLSYLLDSPTCCVAVRNDGAMTTLRQYFSHLNLDSVVRVPDGGFFYKPPLRDHIEVPNSGYHIAINIAGDMQELRFPGGQHHDPPGFQREFAHCLTTLLDADADRRLVFVPHIYRDLSAIYAVVDAMPDPLRRTRVSVAPYMTGMSACDKVFGVYQACDLALGMRFHANVCSIAMAKPTLGLANYPQIENLYREIDLSEQLVGVNVPGFQQHLLNKIEDIGANPDAYIDAEQRRVSALKIDMSKAMAAIDEWLRRNIEIDG